MNTPPVRNETSAAGEKTIYQAPRSGSAIFSAIFSLVLALLFGGVYLVLSGWSQNIIEYAIPGYSSQSDATMAQAVRIFSLGALALAGFALLFGFLQLITALGSRVVLTDQRVKGKTGRNLLRKFDIPLENIAWVEYPNRILSKGPLTIHTKDGRQTMLLNIAKVETFLGYLENAYEVGQPAYHTPADALGAGGAGGRRGDLDRLCSFCAVFQPPGGQYTERSHRRDPGSRRRGYPDSAGDRSAGPGSQRHPATDGDDQTQTDRS